MQDVTSAARSFSTWRDPLSLGKFHARFGDLSAYEYFVSRLDPRVVLELDVYWAAAGGQDVPALIGSVYEALSRASTRTGQPEREEVRPAVPVKKSVTPDYIVCLEDGKKFKSLKRHIRTHYNLSPEEYREKWGLPHDYPMVAPNYARQRSDLAKKMGLGTRRD